MNKNLIYVYINGDEYVKQFVLFMSTILKEKKMFDILVITETEWLENIKEACEQLKVDSNRMFFVCVASTCQVNNDGKFTGKLEISQFEHVDQYEKVIYSDVDILYSKNSLANLFNLIEKEDTVYIASENINYKQPWFFHEKIYSTEECEKIDKGYTNGLNTGLFGWKSNKDSKVFKQIEQIKNNIREKAPFITTDAAEQPYINHRFFVDGNFSVVFNTIVHSSTDFYYHITPVWENIVLHYTYINKIPRMTAHLQRFLDSYDN